MQKNHTIYLVTPCRNAEGTIRQTFQSILSQKGDFILYYHVQDAISSDTTIHIIKEWAGIFALCQHIHFSFSSEQDLNMYDGIAKSFNKFDIAQDAFMGWINADDILDENALQNLCKAATLFPEYSWFGGFSTCTDMANTISPPDKVLAHPQILLREGLCDIFFWPCLQQEGTFWKKKLWDKAGGIDTNFSLAGDWDLWRRMANYDSYIQLPCIMGIFRFREGQLSSDTAAYRQEINKFLPFSTRRNSFNKIYKLKHNIPYTQIISKDGNWVLSKTLLSLSKKRKLKLFLLHYQFDILLLFLQYINKVSKILFKNTIG